MVLEILVISDRTPLGARLSQKTKDIYRSFCKRGCFKDVYNILNMEGFQRISNLSDEELFEEHTVTLKNRF